MGNRRKTLMLHQLEDIACDESVDANIRVEAATQAIIFDHAER